MNKKNTSILLSLLLLTACGGGISDNNNATLPVIDLTSGNFECVSLNTTKGPIVLALDKIKAPKTVANYLIYVQDAFYNGTLFHRVIKNFMIQGGGYDQAFNKKTTNNTIPNEANNGLLNVRGSIAAARKNDPQSATSQFFINTVNNSHLNFKNKTAFGWGFAVFGQVVTGMNVVDAISQVPTGAKAPLEKDVPFNNIVMQTVTVISCNDVKK